MMGICLFVERKDHMHVFIRGEKNKVIPCLCVDISAKSSGERVLGRISFFVQG